MNKNLNLAEILKNCPKGTKLYSTVFGYVFFKRIDDCAIYPIVISCKNGNVENFTNDGKIIIDYDGECTLFPSKDQRDWNKFSAPWYKNSKFKDGDIVAVGKNSELQVFILQIAKNNINGYCYIGYDFKLNKIFSAGMYEFDRFATEEEKQKLFNAIKEKGYKWDAKTKTLYKVEPKFKVGDKIVHVPMKYMGGSGTQATISEITNDKYIFTDGSYTYIINQDNWELVIDKKEKFDPKTLQPFDRVLVRDYNDDKWVCSIFSHIEA